ncbi:diguanylate cyclase (GGDEF)-like protein [Altererythrobacter atlanticus]|uniref:Cyclic di-GMP phosphodiesterase Gmr n=1 Tax=Croceibacterium atlanticum TaxID=1267766 RepID=A0A0F7KTE3_9SPHN|nr:bifunctional diguanylate cyclase/phosphodiesterase [Croceibacterium atlanticum]AKH43678.1 Cyclic di-GMP phosphodiesterase Gmr [Croceibacterium atlanticum]MBB5733838.1 diguanylate cyclase (GGDEF)-like protein [Croceibacterium atlanticum]
MKLFFRQMTVHPAVLIVVPVAVLTLISVVILGLLLFSLERASFSTTSIIVGGAVTYAVAAFFVVRHGLASISRLQNLGLTDSLAGLPNRRALHLDYVRAGQGKERALALVDLDGFKMVNDQYGHFVGDRLIRECASLLKEMCGDEARAYRLGGDEFAILVQGPISGNILEGICRSLLSRLEKPITVDQRNVVIGASVGLSKSGPSDDHSSSELLRRSDVAMYASKAAGKNRCTWFSAEFDRNRDLAQKIEEDLRETLQADRLTLAYQPLVDAQDGEIVAVEALLRWRREDGSEMSPSVFISVAEQTGLIYPIGLWVLRTACTDAANWDHIKVSINVSAAQLRNPEFPIDLGQILEETGFPASRLELEVTETYLVTDPVVAGRNLEVIRGFGVSIVLDDFGSGYASIGFLRNFRFEKLKIDRSLIVDAANDDGSLAMLASSIATARAMNMAVTAEGVETKAQADLVRSAGCDQIQGWFYYKAISADEVSIHLCKNRQMIEEAHAHVG